MYSVALPVYVTANARYATRNPDNVSTTSVSLIVTPPCFKVRTIHLTYIAIYHTNSGMYRICEFIDPRTFPALTSPARARVFPRSPYL